MSVQCKMPMESLDTETASNWHRLVCRKAAFVCATNPIRPAAVAQKTIHTTSISIFSFGHSANNNSNTTIALSFALSFCLPVNLDITVICLILLLLTGYMLKSCYTPTNSTTNRFYPVNASLPFGPSDCNRLAENLIHSALRQMTL